MLRCGCSVGACIHGWGVGWGGIRTSLALSHICHAMLLYVLLDFHTYVMLRYCTISWTSTHTSCYATVLKGSWKNLKCCCEQKTAEQLWKRMRWGALNKTPKWRFRVGEMTVFIFLLGTKAFKAFTLKSHGFLLARAHQTWSATSHESKKYTAI